MTTDRARLELAKRKASTPVLTSEFAAKVNDAVGKTMPDKMKISDLRYRQNEDWNAFIETLSRDERIALSKALGGIWRMCTTVGQIRKLTANYITPHFMAGKVTIAFMMLAFKK